MYTDNNNNNGDNKAPSMEPTEYCECLLRDIKDAIREQMNLTSDEYRGKEAVALRDRACFLFTDLLDHLAVYADGGVGLPASKVIGRRYCSPDLALGDVLAEYGRRWKLVKSKMRLHNLEGRPPAKTALGVHPNTREWLYRLLDDQLISDLEPLVALKASENWGLSCFLADFCSKYPERVIGQYFFDENNTLDFDSVLEFLIIELNCRLPGFACNSTNEDSPNKGKGVSHTSMHTSLAVPLSKLPCHHNPLPGDDGHVSTPLTTPISTPTTTPASTPRRDTQSRPQTPSQRCFSGSGVANAIWGTPDQCEPAKSPRKGRGMPSSDSSQHYNTLGALTNDMNHLSVNNKQEHQGKQTLTPLDKRYVIVMDLSRVNPQRLQEINDFLKHLASSLPPWIKVIVAVALSQEVSILKDIPHSSISSREHMNAHISDIEHFLKSNLQDIFVMFGCTSARFLEEQLDVCFDNFMSATAGRFDYAKELILSFEKYMAQYNKQIITCMKKSLYDLPLKFTKQKMESEIFNNVYRAYRIKTGSSAQIRINANRYIDHIKFDYSSMIIGYQ